MVDEESTSQDWSSFVKSLLDMEGGMAEVAESRAAAEVLMQQREKEESSRALLKVAEAIQKCSAQKPANPGAFDALASAWGAMKKDAQRSLDERDVVQLQVLIPCALLQLLAIISAPRSAPGTPSQSQTCRVQPTWCDALSAIAEVPLTCRAEEDKRIHLSCLDFFSPCLYVSRQCVSRLLQECPPELSLLEAKMQEALFWSSQCRNTHQGCSACLASRCVSDLSSLLFSEVVADDSEQAIYLVKLKVVKQMAELKNDALAVLETGGDGERKQKSGLNLKDCKALKRVACSLQECHDYSPRKESSLSTEQVEVVEEWLAGSDTKKALHVLDSEVAALRKQAMAEAIQKLATATQKCSESSLGKTDKTSWRAGMDEASFAKLAERAQKTLLTAGFAARLKHDFTVLTQEIGDMSGEGKG